MSVHTDTYGDSALPRERILAPVCPVCLARLVSVFEAHCHREIIAVDAGNIVEYVCVVENGEQLAGGMGAEGALAAAAAFAAPGGVDADSGDDRDLSAFQKEA